MVQGAERYLLFTAMKNDIPVKKLSQVYNNITESDSNNIRLMDKKVCSENIKVSLFDNDFVYRRFD